MHTYHYHVCMHNNCIMHTSLFAETLCDVQRAPNASKRCSVPHLPNVLWATTVCLTARRGLYCILCSMLPPDPSVTNKNHRDPQKLRKNRNHAMRLRMKTITTMKRAVGAAGWTARATRLGAPIVAGRSGVRAIWETVVGNSTIMVAIAGLFIDRCPATVYLLKQIPTLRAPLVNCKSTPTSTSNIFECYRFDLKLIWKWF